MSIVFAGCGEDEGAWERKEEDGGEMGGGRKESPKLDSDIWDPVAGIKGYAGF